jgi:hypothetical protein
METILSLKRKFKTSVLLLSVLFTFGCSDGDEEKILSPPKATAKMLQEPLIEPSEKAQRFLREKRLQEGWNKREKLFCAVEGANSELLCVLKSLSRMSEYYATNIKATDSEVVQNSSIQWESYKINSRQIAKQIQVNGKSNEIIIERINLSNQGKTILEYNIEYDKAKKLETNSLKPRASSQAGKEILENLKSTGIKIKTFPSLDGNYVACVVLIKIR